MNKLAALFGTATSPADYAHGFCDRFVELARRIDPGQVGQLIEVIEAANERDATVILAGNGGAAAVAGHWVMDLGVNNVVDGARGFRVISLADNAATVTALANDLSFADIFVQQLRSMLRPGDVVIALSVSGNSPNVVRAIEYANDHGAVTVSLTGFDGGRLRQIAQHGVHIECTRDEYGPVEDLFGMVMHTVTGYLAQKRGRVLHH